MNEDSLKELQDNMKCNNIYIIGILEGKEKEQGIENPYEKNVSKLPLLVMKVQKAQRVPIMMNPKKSTLRHAIMKMAKFKDKERILNTAREKQLVTYKGAPIRLTADFSTETLSQK